MNLNRPEVVEKPQSGADVPGQPNTGFYIVCHGMFLFELLPDSLVIHIPRVGALLNSPYPGHVYRGGDLANPRDLSGDSPYTFTGVSGTRLATGIQNKDNVVLIPSTKCDFAVDENQRITGITCPRPDSYQGWRQVARGGTGPLLKTANTCVNLPETLWETHIFYYSDVSSPALTADGSDIPFWPNPTPAENRLHLFAQPEQPVDPPEGMEMDHTDRMNAMFKTNPPNIEVADSEDVMEIEGPLPPGFQRHEVIDLGETLKMNAMFKANPPNIEVADSEDVKEIEGPLPPGFQRHEVIDLGETPKLFRVVNGQIVGCRSYFIIRP